MIKLNHANLTSYDVPSLTEFFETVFGLRTEVKRGFGFAVLRDDNGFILTLMHDKHMTPDAGYPGLFHVGFVLSSREEVDARYSALTSASYTAPKPKKLQRGGPPTYGFYCNAPGGVMVEVSTWLNNEA